LYLVFTFRYNYVLENSKVLIVPLNRCDKDLLNLPIKEEIKDEKIHIIDDDNKLLQTE
jgi:hypothetical protein